MRATIFTVGWLLAGVALIAAIVSGDTAVAAGIFLIGLALTLNFSASNWP